ncbi:MAG TPA: hypothetical protein DIC34_17060 [Treponema sp.]|nr:MAG: hypothetical protein A2001_15945 [Treponema sp. GWC1_61_84]HCM28217.1 hypothetical protein [Treponema sp.]
MKANLHLHSRFSDGTDWPADIVRRAAAAGLEHVALTDHDTLAGTAEFAAEAIRSGIKTTVGVEIDCREASIDYKSELLAYFPEGGFARTEAFLAEICRDRLDIARKAVAAASRLFPSAALGFEALLGRKRADRAMLPPERFSFNKVDVFLYLKAAGAIRPDMEYRLFKKTYFDSRLLIEKSHDKPSCAEVAKVVRSDGGFLVIPHIGHEFADSAETIEKERKRFSAFLDYFRSIGIAGLELYWYRNGETKAINRLIRKEAKSRGLFCTFGSDCHGPSSGKETLPEFSGAFAGFPRKNKTAVAAGE